MTSRARLQHWLYIFCLMLAGESIYMLPYMRKTFQTTMEASFGVSATELGLLNAMFGVLALLCYFPSGWVADRFSARKLLSISLLATGLGGLSLLVSTSYSWLIVVHGFWGITTILTFWSALIKATRAWGDTGNQGLAFGLLAAGRGVVAAVLATIATALFAYAATPALGLRNVILVYSIAPLLAGAIVWWVVPDDINESRAKTERADGFGRIGDVLGKPEVWLLAIIVFCAYFIYIGTFDFPAFAEQAYGQSKAFGATLGTIRDWMRPAAALGAGLLADRFNASRIIGLGFTVLAVTFLSLFSIEPSSAVLWLLWSQVIASALAVFALRGIYFALLEEIRIPQATTGLTVGIVSFVGFLPDTFGYWLSGWLVDTWGATAGHRIHFGLLAGVALIGFAATIFVRRRAQ